MLAERLNTNRATRARSDGALNPLCLPLRDDFHALIAATGQPALADRLERAEVMTHPWVVGELALGGLANRTEILRLLSQLPQAPVVTPPETLAFIEHHQLSGLGIGYLDVQLLASTLLAGDARLWTRDRKLASAADQLGVADQPPND